MWSSLKATILSDVLNSQTVHKPSCMDGMAGLNSVVCSHETIIASFLHSPKLKSHQSFLFVFVGNKGT